MKSALRLDNRKHPAYANIPEPPLPTLHFQKLSHSLPLLLHLLISSIFIIFSVIISIVAHLFDGSGVKKSWNMATTILHSFMKSILMISSPSGRYSLDTIRFFTSFKIPDFLFRNCTFLADKVIIQATEGLAKLVRNCLDISPDQLRYLNDETGIRNIGVEWIKPKKSIQGQGSVVLFLHGGAHIFLSPNSHRSITTRLATMTNSVVCALDYRLAPEFPFPCAIEDAIAVYASLIGAELNGTSVNFGTLENAKSIPATDIVLVGDSSGACLVLQLLKTLSLLKLPLPAGAILLSPFLDLEIKSSTWHSNFNSDFMSLDHLGAKYAMEIYSNGIPLNHSSISPLFFEKSILSAISLIPILIQCGDSEVVYDDALQFFYSLHSDAFAELQVFKDMFHVFQTFPFLNASHIAFERISMFINSATSKNLDSNSSDGTECDLIEKRVFTF